MPPVTLGASGPAVSLRLSGGAPACAPGPSHRSRSPRTRVRRQRAAPEQSLPLRRCAGSCTVPPSASRSIHRRPPTRSATSTRAMSAGWPASSASSRAASVAAPSPATRGSDGIASCGTAAEDAARLVDEEIAVAEAPNGGRRSLADAHLEPVREHALDARPLHPGQALDAVLRGAAVEAQHRARRVQADGIEDVAVQRVAVPRHGHLGQAEAGKLDDALDLRQRRRRRVQRAWPTRRTPGRRCPRRRPGPASATGASACGRDGGGGGEGRERWLVGLLLSGPGGALAIGSPASKCRHRSLPVATGLLDHPAHELCKRQSGMGRQLWNERGRRHARLRIHFQANQLARAAGGVVVAEVRPRNAAAAQCFMSRQR